MKYSLLTSLYITVILNMTFYIDVVVTSSKKFVAVLFFFSLNKQFHSTVIFQWLHVYKSNEYCVSFYNVTTECHNNVIGYPHFPCDQSHM